MPTLVDEVLRDPGQPLDHATRAFMESRFGLEFSEVRVHTDMRAAESARGGNALAYTVGRDVVVSAGQYEAYATVGQRLLAHELTHVVQQRSATAGTSVVPPDDAAEVEAERNARFLEGHARLTVGEHTVELARQRTQTTVDVVTPTGPNVCGLDRHRTIFPAVSLALNWLNQAIPKLSAFVVSPAAPGNAPAARALTRHFSSAAPATATHVRDRLDAVRTDIRNRTPFTVECHGIADSECKRSSAYVPGRNRNMMVFCPSFFDGSEWWRAEAVVHEMAHALTGGVHITDRGYASDRVYPLLTTAEALTNAESYGLLVRELGTGRVPPMPTPTDEFEDCPDDDWKPLLRVAVARAQRWNRNAQVAVGDRDPAWLARWRDLQNTYLGGPGAAALDAAQRVYDEAVDKLRDAVEFECEPQGGGRCDHAATYWYGLWSDYHICPAWKAIASENDRIVALLAGLYGFFGIVDDSAWRQRYAGLARDLTNRFWP